MIKTSFQLFLLIKTARIRSYCVFIVYQWMHQGFFFCPWKCANTSWFTSYFETHYGRTPWIILIEKLCNFQDFPWNLWIFFWIWPRICFRCASRGRTCTGAFFWSVLKKAFWNRNPDLLITRVNQKIKGVIFSMHRQTMQNFWNFLTFFKCFKEGNWRFFTFFFQYCPRGTEILLPASKYLFSE